MATLENEIIIITIGLAYSYLVLYPKSKLLGNVAYALCGLAIMAFNTGNTYSAVGLLILLGSIINAILDLIPKKT